MSMNSQNLRIYSIIEQLEDVLGNSPRPRMGGANKRVVDVAVLMDLLGDLKVTIPDDIRRANSIILQAESMISNADEHARELVESAQAQADEIIKAANLSSAQILEKAKEEYERLVAEDEIYQEAQKRAELLAMKAEYNAEQVFETAKLYADELLADLERFLGEYKQQVSINRRELNIRAQQAQPVSEPNTAAAQAATAQSAAAQNAAAPEPAAPVEEQVERKPAAAATAAAQKPAQAEAPAAEESDLEDNFFDDEEIDYPRRGLFGLFRRRKKAVAHEDFED